MEAEHIIDEQVTIEETTVGAIYEKSLLWLKKMKTKITLRRLDRLEAIYENPSGGDDTPTHKLITIHLSETEDGVNARLVIDSDIQKKLFDLSLTKTAWGDWVESFWSEFGVEVTEDMLKELYSKRNLGIVNAVDLGKSSIQIIIGLVFVIWIYSSQEDSPLPKILFSLYGVYIIVYYVFIILKNRKRYQDLYPDYVS